MLWHLQFCMLKCVCVGGGCVLKCVSENVGVSVCENSYPLQYSGLENAIDCINHGVAKSQTRLSDFHFYTLY